jgi:hypothetical protein
MSNSAPAERHASNLPPLYSRLEPLTAERHRKLRLRDAGFGFAAKHSAVPLAAEEFAAASRHYAIVFGTEAPHTPVALTGLRSGTNTYLEPNGQWRPSTYLPSYLRRFPFFLARVSEAKPELTLCLDPTAPHISETEGEPLFDDAGKPTPQAVRAFEFSRMAEAAFVRTGEMMAGLLGLGLLGPVTLEFPQETGKPLRIDGFHGIQRKALAALTGEQLVQLRDKGWLDAIYAHLHSLDAIREMAQRNP